MLHSAIVMHMDTALPSIGQKPQDVKQVNLRLPINVYNGIATEARANRRSFTAQAIIALEEHIEREAREASAAA